MPEIQDEEFIKAFKSFSDDDFVEAFRAHSGQTAAVSPSLLQSRQAASRSEFDANLPPESKIENAGLKTVLDAPLDFAAGVERAVGIDPMHPIASSPRAVWNAVKGVGKLLGTEGPLGQLNAAKDMVMAPAEAVKRGGQAIREGNIPEMMQAVGEGYGTAKPAVEAASAVAPIVKAAPRAIAERVTTPGRMDARAAANRAPLPPKTNIVSDLVASGTGAAVARVAGLPPEAGALAAEAVNLARRSPVYRAAKASAQEAFAKWLRNGEPSALQVFNEESARMKDIERQGSERVPLTDAPKVGIERPSVPSFVESQLEKTRGVETPQEVFDRMVQQRNQEIPTATTEAPKLGIQRPQPPEFKFETPRPTELTPEAVNKWMGVTPKEVLHGANPGQVLLDEKLIGDSRTATKANIATALDAAGKELHSQLKAASEKGVTIDAQTPTYDATTGATKRIGSPKDAAFNAQINGIVDDIEAKYPDLSRLSPEQAHALKVELGDAIDWTGNDSPANQAMIKIYRDINGQLKAIEGIGKVQEKWGGLYIASKSLKGSIAGEVVGKPALTVREVFEKMQKQGMKKP